MNIGSPALVLIAALVCLEVDVGSGRAQTPLADESPFSAGEVAGPATGGTAGSLELRGVMATSEGPRFCIFDTVRHRSAWVGLNETGYPFVVDAADLEGDEVTIDQLGQRVTLTLRRGKVSSSGASSFTPGSSLNTRRRGPIPINLGGPSEDSSLNSEQGGSPAARATAEAESRRLKALLEDLRRQRSAEAQSPQQGGATDGAATQP